MAKRVVLAYSGGLDTSVAVRWMIEHLGVEVICVSADVGQEGTLEGNARRRSAPARSPTRSSTSARSSRRDYLAPVIKANALYEGKYPLVSALSPAADRASTRSRWRGSYGADGVAHGCTGKGNDQVRFEVSAMALAPDLELVAPVRNWGFTREDSIDYAEQHGIPVRATKEKLYSIDDNLWGRAIECGEMEDPWAEPPVGRVGDDPPDRHRAARGHDRVRGRACRSRSTATSCRSTRSSWRSTASSVPTGGVASTWSRTGESASRAARRTRRRAAWRSCWPTPTSSRSPSSATCSARRSASSTATPSSSTTGCGSARSSRRSTRSSTSPSSHVTGEVRLELEPGRCYVGRAARRPKSLYDYGLATYDAADRFRHADSEGFVRLWGLSVQTWAEHPGGRVSDAADPTERRGGEQRRCGTAGSRPVRPPRCGTSRSASATTAASRPTTCRGSRAHAEGLGRAGMLSKAEAAPGRAPRSTTVEVEMRRGLASGSSSPTRTSTPPSSGGSPSWPGRPEPSSTPAARATTRWPPPSACS